MARFGECAGDGDIGGDDGVGGVDDAERGFAAFHQEERAAHGVAAGEAVLGGGPEAKAGEGLLGVDAGRDIGRVAGGDAAIRAEQGFQVETGIDRDGMDPVARHDQNQSVAEQSAPCVGDDQVMLVGPVHPLLVGRGEEVGNGALIQLAGEGGGGGEAEAELAVAFRLPERGDVAQGVGQGGGGENGQVGRLGGRGDQQDQEDEEAAHLGLRFAMYIRS